MMKTSWSRTDVSVCRVSIGGSREIQEQGRKHLTDLNTGLAIGEFAQGYIIDLPAQALAYGVGQLRVRGTGKDAGLSHVESSRSGR